MSEVDPMARYQLSPANHVLDTVDLDDGMPRDLAPATSREAGEKIVRALNQLEGLCPPGLVAPGARSMTDRSGISDVRSEARDPALVTVEARAMLTRVVDAWPGTITEDERTVYIRWLEENHPGAEAYIQAMRAAHEELASDITALPPRPSERG